nr:MAG TPA: beta clamp protein [Inoviridae sp.]
MQTKEFLKAIDTIHSLITYNPIKPMTGLVEFYAKDGEMKLGGTDGFTTVVVKIDCDGDMENAVVSLPMLLKLVKLTSKESVSIKNKGKYIEFNGNGKYKIPIQVEADGSAIQLPLSMKPMLDGKEYSAEEFDRAVKRNKVAVYSGDEHEEFTLYHNKDGTLVTTNSAILAITGSVELPIGDIKPFIVESLSKLDGKILMDNYRVRCENIEIQFNNKIWNSFPVELVEPFLSIRLTGAVGVDKKMLLNTIKRQSVFRNPFEEPSIKFCVENNELWIKNTQGTSEEKLDICVDMEDKEAVVKTDYVLGVLKNMENELNLYIEDDFICIEDNIGRYIISVME